jgi:uncharacterized protein (DUF885 family)
VRSREPCKRSRSNIEGGGDEAPGSRMTAVSDVETNLCRAVNALDQIWQRRNDTFLQRVFHGRTVDRFPDLSESAVSASAAQARRELEAIQRIDVCGLPHELALTLKSTAFHLGIELQGATRYWLAQEQTFPAAIFPVGPYGSGYLFSFALKVFKTFNFNHPTDRDRYLALIEDYARLIDQIREKLSEQAARGIRIPAPALPGRRALVAHQASAACAAITIEPDRLRQIPGAGAFKEIVDARIGERLTPAFSLLLEILGEDYASRAPSTVGLAQYPGGNAVYEMLVAEHLSLPMTVDAVHRKGYERMARIEDEMARIRSALGYADRETFHRYLLTDSQWIGKTATDLVRRFDAAIGRIEPHVGELFRKTPQARYRTERLDPQLESGMTYGHYQEPMAGHPEGVYYFNASNLSEQTLATAAALIFHELIPGHHFHSASQRENELIHPMRHSFFCNAFNEGWAEYAATLAREVGAYEGPVEEYGRLLMDAFLTSRLVVDTGLNALGWSLDEARQYMRAHTIQSEAEIASETLRYSTDIPAQSLSYKIGEDKIMMIRESARSTLGTRFDIRDFHEVVLGSGAMPLQILEWHVRQWTDRETSGVSRAVRDSAMDQVSHHEARIRAPLASIWPHILTPESWKKGPKLRSVSGQVGQVGQRFLAVARDDPDRALFAVENVEIVPGRRRTIRLNTLKGDLIGYASWCLTAEGESTRLEYDVYCQFDQPAGLKGEVEPATSHLDAERFEEELGALKKLLEPPDQHDAGV